MNNSLPAWKVLFAGLLAWCFTLGSASTAEAKTYYFRVYMQNGNMTPTVQNLKVTLTGSSGQTYSKLLAPNHGTANNGGQRPFDQSAISIFYVKDLWYDYKLTGVNDLGHVISVKLECKQNPNAGKKEVIAVEKATVWHGNKSEKKTWKFWTNSNKVLSAGEDYTLKVNGWDQTTPSTLTKSDITEVNFYPTDNLIATLPINLGSIAYTHLESDTVTTTDSIEKTTTISYSLTASYGKEEYSKVEAQFKNGFKTALLNSVQKSSLVTDSVANTQNYTANPQEYRMVIEVVRNNHAEGTFNLKLDYILGKNRREGVIPVNFDIKFGTARQYFQGVWNHVPTAQEIAALPAIGNDQGVKDAILGNWGNDEGPSD